MSRSARPTRKQEVKWQDTVLEMLAGVPGKEFDFIPTVLSRTVR